MFLEGRLDGHKSVYLDQTEAYIEAPRVSLDIAFTVACWIRLSFSTPHYRPILSSENGGTTNGKFSIGVDTENQLLLDNWSGGTYYIRKNVATLRDNEWIHVAVTYAQDVELAFFINGMKNLSVVHVWQGPSGGQFDIGRYKNASENKYRYFHGFLSDLYVFSRALNSEEIGQLMGKSITCLKVDDQTCLQFKGRTWLREEFRLWNGFVSNAERFM